MSILAIDTASQVSSVAVATGDRLVAEVTMQAKLTHSETLMPHIEQALRMASVQRADLAGIAVSIGPGSFTGLRIGLAAAKAMAYALGIPLVGVPSLHVLAAHFPVPGVQVVPLIDAQKGNAYMERCRWEDGELVVEEEVAVRPIAACVAACAGAEPVILLGDALRHVAGRMELPANVRLAPLHLRMPRAANVAFLGGRRLARGEQDSVMDMEPLYIRRSEAEVLWEKRHPEAAR